MYYVWDYIHLSSKGNPSGFECTLHICGQLQVLSRICVTVCFMKIWGINQCGGLTEIAPLPLQGCEVHACKL